MLLILSLLVMPVCATIAGLVVGASNRGQPLEDGALVRHFLLIMAICVALAWGVSRTDAFRLRFDSQFRLQTQVDAHPVYSTLKRLAPDHHRELHNFLAAQMSRGGTLSDAFLQARPLLTRLATSRLGFTDQKTHLTWGRVSADTLRELRNRDPLLCYQALSSQLTDQQTLALAFSTDNTKAFQEAVVGIYESADRGMRQERPADDKPVEFNTVAREYHVISDAITQRFGEPVSRQLSKKNFPEPPAEPADKMCAARIFQLEAMLDRPQAMASRLLDSVMR